MLINLHEGGFAAYVAASHAQTRDGLCISRLVTLDQLNKPLPSDLLQEARRFDAIEHNTYIKHGFCDGTVINVPDAEAECLMKHPKAVAAEFDTDNSSAKMKRKRTFSEIDAGVGDSQPTLHNHNKRRKGHLHGCETQSLYCPVKISAGCTWSSEDWSCSYDSAFMVLFHAYRRGNTIWKGLWILDQDELRVSLSHSFCVLASQTHIHLRDMFNHFRDKFRDVISAQNPQRFPRTGMVGASITCILESILPSLSQSLHGVALITDLEHVNIPVVTSIELSFEFPTMCVPLPESVVACDESISLQQWVDLWLSYHATKTSAISERVTSAFAWDIKLATSPCFIFFHAIHHSVKPSLGLTIPCSTDKQVQYVLCGIIYLGAYHFSARILDDSNVWSYDGRENDGNPLFDAAISDIDKLDISCLRGREAHVYVYSLQNADQLQT